MGRSKGRTLEGADITDGTLRVWSVSTVYGVCGGVCGLGMLYVVYSDDLESCSCSSSIEGR